MADDAREVADDASRRQEHVRVKGCADRSPELRAAPEKGIIARRE